MRAEKQLLLDDLKQKIEGSEAFVVAKHTKLNSMMIEDLRQALFDANADLEVVKKRVFVKAAEAAGVLGIDLEQLEGSIAVVFANEDPVGSTKAVFKFAKDNKDTIEVLCGQFDGKTVTADQVEKLSQLPGKDEMRAQLLGLFEAPMAQTLSTMEALLTSVIYCLDNKSKEGQES